MVEIAEDDLQIFEQKDGDQDLSDLLPEGEVDLVPVDDPEYDIKTLALGEQVREGALDEQLGLFDHTSATVASVAENCLLLLQPHVLVGQRERSVEQVHFGNQLFLSEHEGHGDLFIPYQTGESVVVLQRIR